MNFQFLFEQDKEFSEEELKSTQCSANLIPDSRFVSASPVTSDVAVPVVIRSKKQVC